VAHVHRYDEAFADRNAFLQATLGALSWCRTLADLVVVLGPVAREAPPPAAPNDDAFLDAAVGIASLWRLAMQGLEASVESAEPTPVAGATHGEPRRPDLRSMLA